MRALLCAAALALSQGQALEVDTSFQGTPAEALAAVQNLAGGEPERAAALADSFAKDERHPEALRAEFRFAQGVVLAGAGGDGPAAQAFASARALAGPGELRIAATYNQGTAELRAAEALRMETFRRLQDPAGAGAAAAPGSGADPLAVLRQAYLRAKGTLLERLRADFTGEDARANLELIQRRLRELDELERQAEEEQQQQEQQQEEQQQGEQDEQQKSEGEEGEQQEGEGQESQQSEQPGEEQKEEQPDQGAADPLQDLQPSGELPDVQPGDESSGEPAERVLSHEEVMRLLDRLDELEDEAQVLEALLRATRRIPVDKDW